MNEASFSDVGTASDDVVMDESPGLQRLQLQTFLLRQSPSFEKLVRDRNLTPRKFLGHLSARYDLPRWLDQSVQKDKQPILPASFDLEKEYFVEEFIWDAFHSSSGALKPSGSGSSGFSDPDKANFLHDAFTGLYKGNAPARFCQVLQEGYASWYNPERHYGRIIAVVQSSAMGKTRLMYEIGKEKIPVFTLCFRESQESKSIDPSQGWPYGDEPIISYFHHCGQKFGVQFTPEECIAAFLGALYENLARCAGEGLDCFRDLAPGLDTAPREHFLRNVCAQASQNLIRPTSGHMSTAERCQALFSQYVQEHAEALDREVGPHSQFKSARFILVLDECSVLNKLGSTNDRNAPGYLTAFRRIFKAGDAIGASQNFWLVLLDTHGETYALYPVHKELAPSARLIGGKLVALPPWIDLGLDLNLPSTSPKTPTEALTVKWLQHAGRPYWAHFVPTQVLPEATAKLLCAERLYSEKLDHVVTVLSRRIYLPIRNDLPAATNVHLAGVEKHMRIMRSIGWDNGLVETAAVSEPVLSIAAAVAMLNETDAYCKTIQTFLNDALISKHLLERGRLGETVAAVVLMMARDAATCSVANDKKLVSTFVTEDPLAVNPVNATSFMQALFPKDDVPQDFGSTFGDMAWMNFTHMDILPTILDHIIPMELLLKGWCRGVAFQCADNQPIYDLLIPLYLGNLDLPFDPLHLSYITVQVKARMEAAPKTVVDSLTGPLVKVGPESVHKPPYLAVLMDLGTLVGFQATKRRVRSRRCRASRPHEKTTLSIQLHYGDDEPERWVFDARGLTHDTYPVIELFNVPAIRDVLYDGNIVNEDQNEGREVVRSAAMEWNEEMGSILMRGLSVIQT